LKESITSNMNRQASTESLITECDCAGHQPRSTPLCDWDSKVVADLVLNESFNCDNVSQQLNAIEKEVIQKISKNLKVIGEFILLFAPSGVNQDGLYENINQRMAQLKITEVNI